MKRFIFLFTLLLIAVGIEAKPVVPCLGVGEDIALVGDNSQDVVACEQVAILELSFIDLRVGLAQIGVDVGEYRLSPILGTQTDGLFYNELSNTAIFEPIWSSLQEADTKSRTGFMGFGIGQINRWTITSKVGMTNNKILI